MKSILLGLALIFTFSVQANTKKIICGSWEGSYSEALDSYISTVKDEVTDSYNFFPDENPKELLLRDAYCVSSNCPDSKTVDVKVWKFCGSRN